MEKEIKVSVKVEAVIVIDEDEWPEDWDLLQECAHQIGFDNAVEYEVTEATAILVGG